MDVVDVTSLGATPRAGAFPSAQVSGWVLKRKSDTSRSRLFVNTNRRFFTVDFRAQQIYYSHSDVNSKMVSSPIAFREIVCVDPLGVEQPCDVEADKSTDSLETQTMKRQNSNCSLASGLRIPRIPSFSRLTRSQPKIDAEQHGFTLRTSSKTMEFLCASKADADRFVAALRSAMMQGASFLHQGKSMLDRSNEGVKRDVSTTAGSSRGVSPLSFDVANSQSSGPPSTQGSFRELSNPAFDTSNSEHTGQRRAFGLLPTKTPKLEKLASPFQGPTATPATSVRRGQQSEAWQRNTPFGVERGTGFGDRYEDKQFGMTLQQRLQAIEFSDDEDDEDDVSVPSSTKHEAKQVVSSLDLASCGLNARNSEPEPSDVTVDACESFRGPDSDDDQ